MLPQKIMHTLREYRRVILVSKKPDIEELSNISKVAAIGILIIGFLGFIIQSIFNLIK
ncbi:MAG: protein translocase SEC61 complex subunit gamma [Nanoarchaeota archaeon]|nr:protein translocase SEC61 complex subunit gamma [Nanoarchaeota archaeon]